MADQQFAMAAINDSSSPRPRLEGLQPTKEAQEARLAQTYQEALIELQAGNLLKARLLFQSIVEDPIIVQAEALEKENGSDSFDSNTMLHLRFLTLKNLGETLYKQGLKYHSDALDCYLQAAFIDRTDVVLWSRVGTLACALGHLNMARAAFEQGLVCSPRNWLCMEQLVEVLIAVGDEEACRQVVKGLLRILPSHSRAAHIDDVLEGRADAHEILSERVFFNASLRRLNVLPRGLDLLEPQHCSGSFPKKYPLEDADQGTGSAKRKRVQTVDLILPDMSLSALLDLLLEEIEISVGGKRKRTSVAPPPDNFISPTVAGNSTHGPLFNGSQALSINRKRLSTKETAPDGMLALSSTKDLTVLDKQRLSPVYHDGPIAANEGCDPSSKVVLVLEDSLAPSSPRDVPLEEVQRTTDARLKDADPGHTNQPIVVKTSDPSKGVEAMDEDEIPSHGRRSTRLERIRTRGYDKDEEAFLDKDKDGGQCENLERLLEPFITRTSQDAGISSPDIKANVNSWQSTILTSSGDGSENAHLALKDLDAQEGPAVNEGIYVKQFVEGLKVNSGPYHVAHELLEKLATISCKYRIPTTKLLELERITRQFSRTTRSRECCIFLAELCLDMCLSPSFDDVDSLCVNDFDFHLCRVVEHLALNADFRGECIKTVRSEPGAATQSVKIAFTEQEGSHAENKNGRCDGRLINSSRGGSTDIDGDLKNPHHGPDDFVKTPRVQPYVENVDTHTENDWPFWARFHWANAQWHIYSGREEEAYEELTRCLGILDSKAKVNGMAASVWLPHCKVEPRITFAKVQRKLYELQIVKLLKHSAYEMDAQGRYSELIDLLAPFLLPNNESNNIILGSNESYRGTESSPEYVGLSMLGSAFEKTSPADLWLALQCHARKLEILCSALSSCNVSQLQDTRGSQEPARSLSKSDPEQEQSRDSLAESKLVAKEVKLISNCVACIRDISGNSGDMVHASVKPSLLLQTQHLLLDIMCHYIKIHHVGRSPDWTRRSFNLQMDSSCFVDAIVAFCGLQHLDASATLEQQVSLLATVHDVLAARGLCCAGNDSEGGEGTFLKLAIKHLGTVELILRLESKKQESLKVPKSGTNGGLMGFGTKDQHGLPVGCISENEGGVREEAVFIDAGKGKGKKSAKLGKDEGIEETKKRRAELGLDSILDQCYCCLYGLNLRDGLETSSQSDGLAEHRNTNRGEYNTKEQCAAVYQYVLPYAKACSRARLPQLRKVLRAVHKQFPNPPPDVLSNRAVTPFLDDPEFDEDRLSEMVLSSQSLQEIMECALKVHPSDCNWKDVQYLRQVDKATSSHPKQLELSKSIICEQEDPVDTRVKCQTSSSSNIFEMSGQLCGSDSCFYSDTRDPYLEVYKNLYHFLSEIDEISASEKWAGFVLTEEGEGFVEQNAKLLKYDLCYNPLRFKSWFKLAKIYDEEVDLMLNDGSKDINVVDWRRDTLLNQRVEMSRRRTRRCLLMALALANPAEERSEVHERLALVYYDHLQNVAPSYDQRHLVRERDTGWNSLCRKSLYHFEQAFAHKPDWSHLFYMGKLYEKLCRPSEEAFDLYKRAIDMNSSAVDPIYRLHASRLKLLCKSDAQDVKVLQVIAHHCYVAAIKATVSSMLESLKEIGPNAQVSPLSNPLNKDHLLVEVRRLLFEDSATVMKLCTEGELKHYHKARFRLAQGLCSRIENQDMDRAKEELAFCFKSNRSLFTINMWEIDDSLRKTRRKAAHQTNLDVQMLESSRKYITCVRKYLVLYLSLCEKTGDVQTLERAFTFLKTDKKFSPCLIDLSSLAQSKK